MDIMPWFRCLFVQSRLWAARFAFRIILLLAVALSFMDCPVTEIARKNAAMNKSAGFIDLDFMFTDSYFLKAKIYITGFVYASSLFPSYQQPMAGFV